MEKGLNMKPREFWIYKLDQALETKFILKHPLDKTDSRLTHVREVLPEREEAIQKMVEALKEAVAMQITDGCEECSAIWTREYGLKSAKEALEAWKKVNYDKT